MAMELMQVRRSALPTTTVANLLRNFRKNVMETQQSTGTVLSLTVIVTGLQKGDLRTALHDDAADGHLLWYSRSVGSAIPPGACLPFWHLWCHHSPRFCSTTAPFKICRLLHHRNGSQQRTPGLGKQIAVDIARGLQFLHERHIVHLDLKSPNGASLGD